MKFRLESISEIQAPSKYASTKDGETAESTLERIVMKQTPLEDILELCNDIRVRGEDGRAGVVKASFSISIEWDN